MQAIVQESYGCPEVLELREVERPVAQEGEVLIRVHGSSVNYGDWVVMTGQPYAARLFLGLLRPKQAIVGHDVAGVVVAVGARVRRFKPGDEVYGELTTAYAEYVCAPEDSVALKPANLDFEQAAAVPVAAMPGLQGLRDLAKVKPGDKVLINGASGGVGTFAVQIAKALGAEVTGVCSTRNLDMVRSIGADHVVDYTQTDFSQTTERYEVIFDLVGSASLRACTRILSPRGVYIASVGRLGWSLKSALASLISPQRVKVLAAHPDASDLAALRELIEAGAITPVIDRRFSLSEVPAALAHFSRGHARGKSVIRIAA